MKRLVALLLLVAACASADPQRRRAVHPAPTGEWARGAVFYEIFARSFYDSNAQYNQPGDVVDTNPNCASTPNCSLGKITGMRLNSERQVQPGARYIF
ncbi:MAG TPA: hypothetical protein VKU62_01010 [Thermoanaerobaculia bacterium]|nr:hypothetical protein [Thermoanaerobaculia bacterium]